MKTVLEFPLVVVVVVVVVVVEGEMAVRCARISIDIPVAHELVSRWIKNPMFTSSISPS
jgi:hypothetical protein